MFSPETAEDHEVCIPNQNKPTLENLALTRWLSTIKTQKLTQGTMQCWVHTPDGAKWDNFCWVLDMVTNADVGGMHLMGPGEKH